MEDYKKRVKKLFDEIKNMSSSRDEYPSLHPSRKLYLCRLITSYFPEVDNLYSLDWFKSLTEDEEWSKRIKDIMSKLKMWYNGDRK